MKIVRPVEITRIGDVRYVPGPLIASPSGWLAAAASSSVAGLKLNFASTATETAMPAIISITALMICTQVVASMPPKTT